MKRISILYFIIASCCIALISCGKAKKAEEHHEELPTDIVELNEEQIKTADVKLGSIEIRPIGTTLKVNGEIASLPQNMATVSSPMGGRIVKVELIPGSAVRKGQTLALIENTEFVDIQQNYLEAKSKIEYMSADYHRQKALFHNSATSSKNLQLTTSEYKALRTQIKALEQKLLIIGINPHRLNNNNITRTVAVKAPISGYINTVNTSIGKTVEPSDVLFDIVNLNNLFIKLTIFEKDIAKVSKGQPIKFFINDESEAHKAIVYQTAKCIDADKTYKIYAAIQSKCFNILPGMYVNAQITSKTHKAYTLPDESIVNFEGKSYIFVFEKNKTEHGKKVCEYRIVPVSKGVSEQGYTEIVLPKGFDINTNDIVLKGSYTLLSTMKNGGEMSC